jgi:hypothetical protein
MSDLMRQNEMFETVAKHLQLHVSALLTEKKHFSHSQIDVRRQNGYIRFLNITGNIRMDAG